ncbi:hypothetical protein [Vibrio anguillarum]|uniref:hypothetical protein n=1 Tax=Vibrio anguillarum TaxID=55601 RepID=UPI000589E50E|nr:hypothetical protein [Vibrio anguillarum]ASF93709.1 hypothetical protein CEA93_16985 [Vibrio anguillarum]MBT2973910.1 hypothetical protein [Vibrio anguillarum]URM12406.1 hypothetical protein KLK36_18695 [Vibrio anguillarum]
MIKKAENAKWYRVSLGDAGDILVASSVGDSIYPPIPDDLVMEMIKAGGTKVVFDVGAGVCDD